MPDKSKTTNSKKIQNAVNTAYTLAMKNKKGEQANYIPELSDVDPEITGVVLQTIDNQIFTAGTCDFDFTLQSSSKLVVLAGLLEECGVDLVLEWVKVEPSGSNFSSIARLDHFGPKPSNPCVNAGAIALCSHIEGDRVARITWIEKWCALLFGSPLNLSAPVLASEKISGNRNRSIAYLLKSNGLIEGDVSDVLESYFASCSYKANLLQCAYFARLLASGGLSPEGDKILSHSTTEFLISVMATCGLYNESGSHLMRTGLPAKSGVSGIVLACCPSVAGLAVFSPRLSSKGNSVRGEIMLESLSHSLGLHFARPVFDNACFKKK